ncbi:MAG: FprA family A-type flavoprotein [Bacteroidales bacterium]|nr:FprA family A-type flavoprotein [Bacteroidales bacterium]
MESSKILNVTNDVKWVGVLDYDIVTFDIVMETKSGTTYNSYLIESDDIAIIDTVKEKFSDEFLAKIEKITPYERIKYIIVNHTEPDHSGALKNLLRKAPHAIVVGTSTALKYLDDMVDVPFKKLTVKEDDIISLGKKTLKFIMAPNLHWPDSMYTYLIEDKILFTCDSFGAHFCHEGMFEHLVPSWDEEFKYYFDVILKPYSQYMLKAIEKIKNLEINALCTGHGPILTNSPKKYIELTEQYAKEYLNSLKHDNLTVLIVYVSAYGYTAKFANAIAESIKEENLKVIIKDIEKTDLGEMESLIVQSDAILIGSPTINQNTLLPIYKFLAVINPIRDKNKPASVFGSYGWSGEAVKIISAALKELKLNVVKNEGIQAKFNSSNLSSFKEFGKNFADYIKQHYKNFQFSRANEKQE